MEKRKAYSQSGLRTREAARLGINVATSPPSDERWLSPNEIGELLSVTGEAVKVWITKGKLKAHKQLNGYWRVNAVDLTRFLENRQNVRHRILLYDSMTALREAAQHLSALPDFEIVNCSSHTDALLKSRREVPAIVIVNLSSSPGYKPWDFMSHLRSLRHGTRHAGVLLVADRDLSSEEADRGVDVNANGFLKLPCTPAFLEAEVRRIF